MKKYYFSLLLLSVFSFSTFAQITPEQIDQVTEKAIQTFNVPGIAVAVVKDGKVIHSKGYGVKSILTKEKVDQLIEDCKAGKVTLLDK